MAQRNQFDGAIAKESPTPSVTRQIRHPRVISPLNCYCRVPKMPRSHRPHWLLRGRTPRGNDRQCTKEKVGFRRNGTRVGLFRHPRVAKEKERRHLDTQVSRRYAEKWQALRPYFRSESICFDQGRMLCRLNAVSRTVHADYRSPPKFHHV